MKTLAALGLATMFLQVGCDPKDVTVDPVTDTITCFPHGYPIQMKSAEFVSSGMLERMISQIPHDGIDIQVSVSSGQPLGDSSLGNGELDGHDFTVTINGVAHTFGYGAKAVLDALDLVAQETPRLRSGQVGGP